MGVENTKLVGKYGGLTGYIDEYVTLVKGESRIMCDCGSFVKVSYRKKLTKSAPYEFSIVHRNRERLYKSKNPSEFDVFIRMQRVATYKNCNFMKGAR